jgi:uncharacterized protein (DUF4415 family)
MSIKFEPVRTVTLTPPKEMEIASVEMLDDGQTPSIQLQTRRPNGDAKKLISIRVDPEVIAWFKAPGDGWQSRMNEALRKAAGL